MTHRHFLAMLALGVMLFASVPAQADDDLAAEGGAAINNGRISLSAGMDVTNEYYFRGIFQENQGVLMQPWAEVGAALTDNLSLSIGIWNSFHTNASGGVTRANDAWYEADLYVGLGYAVTDKLSVSGTYTAYTSPNNFFATVEEIALGASYDDSGLYPEWLSSGLQPYVTVAFEIDNGADGFEEGIYVELGIEPSWVIIQSESGDVTFSVPVTIGLSASDYYEVDNTSPLLPGVPDGIADDDDAFGYAQVGLMFSVPLNFIPEDFGSWSAHAGVNFLFLGNNTEFMDDRTDDVHYIGVVGFGMEY